MRNKLDIIESKFHTYLEICRSKGLKLTPQRLAIFQEIASSVNHPTVEDIHRKIKKNMPTVSLDTVYRAMAMLSESGTINRVEVLDDKFLYDTNLKIHHHLVCVKCKQVEDFYWRQFDDLLKPELAAEWGIIDRTHVELRGICRECLKKEEKK